MLLSPTWLVYSFAYLSLFLSARRYDYGRQQNDYDDYGGASYYGGYDPTGDGASGYYGAGYQEESEGSDDEEEEEGEEEEEEEEEEEKEREGEEEEKEEEKNLSSEISQIKVK